MSYSTAMQDFVGREHELETLHVALGSALAGQSRTVLLLGEPGIGKTRTLQVFSASAATRDAAVLWGRCHEEPGAPPYWPWLQVIRKFAERLDDNALHAVVGNGAGWILEIVPELKDRVPGVGAPEELAGPAQTRFRLFDEVAQFWKRAAAAQPLLLILEDLQWADIASLRLLEFVVSEVTDSSILFIGTFRDSDGPAQHAFLHLLGELTRKSVVHSLALTGLTSDQTARLADAVTGSRVPESTVAFVHAKARGNPLYVAELMRYLAKAELLSASRSLSNIHEPNGAGWCVPDGIRALVTTRLERLSVSTARLLECAAVIGTRFSFSLLRHLLEDLSEEQVLVALQEALAERIIRDLNQSGCYEFDHVLTRDALYDRMISIDRARLHQHVGAALEEECKHDRAPHLALLAHHFNAATPGASSSKAIDYASRAGEQALARHAYEDAAGYFGLALRTLDQGAQDASRRCKLLIALGGAQTKSGQMVPALEALFEAAKRANYLGAGNDLAEAALEFEEVAWRLGLPGAPALRLLRESLTYLEEDDDLARANLQSAMVRALAFAGRHDEARKLHKATVRLARRIGDPVTLATALGSGFWLQSDPADFDELLSVAHEAITLARQVGDRERVLRATAFRLHLLIAIGDVAGFSRDLDDFAQLADSLCEPFHRYHATAMRAARALFFGSFAEAEQLAREAAKQGTRLPGLNASGALGTQMFTLAWERGELLQLAPLVEQFVRATPSDAVWRPGLVLVLAALGRCEQATVELERLGADRFQAVARDSLWPASLAYLAEACVLVGDRGHAEELYSLLLPWKGRNLVAASMIACYGPADRFLGMLSTLLRRWDSAARHFEAAIEMTERQRSNPWLAHSQHEYAAMLGQRRQPGDLQRARTLSASALQLAEKLSMTRLKTAASALALTPGSGTPPSYPAGLTRREAEVLRLVAAGKSNQEIAASIFRSPNTVANHVRSILAKLSAANRTEAATFAVRHGLL